MTTPTLTGRLRREAPWFGDLPKAADAIDELRSCLVHALNSMPRHFKVCDISQSDHCTCGMDDFRVRCAKAGVAQ